MIEQLKKSISIIVVLLLLTRGVTTVNAQKKLTEQMPERNLTGKIENLISWFKFGADIRFRHESIENSYLTNADPPGHNYSFERMRVRQWSILNPFKEFEFYIRFNWEGRHYWMPASKEEWDKSEVVFDNLNCKLKFEKIPITIIIGRQDIVFRDGWLVFDGTPLDGPRTGYFDAIRVTIELQSIKNLLDLIYIDQTSSPNRWLSPIFTQSKPLMEQDERGAIINFCNKTIENTQIDAYFIFKQDEAVLSNGDNGKVYTIGSCLVHDFNSNLSGRVELAYQLGNRKNIVMFPNQDSSLSAWGFNSRITYSFHDSLKSQVWLGYEVLSGNDANDTHNRQFDPLWSRWAKYSELFPNDLDRAGDRSNFHHLFAGCQFGPANGMVIQTNYHVFFAYANRFSGSPGFSYQGNFKGQLFTAFLLYQSNSFWSGKILYEYFIPGNYYNTPFVSGPLNTRNDPAAFLRAEMIITLQY